MNKFKKKMNNKIRLCFFSVVFTMVVIIYGSLFAIDVSACRGTPCGSIGGSVAGSCPGGCSGGVCYVNSRTDYCNGHSYQGNQVDSSTSKTESSRTLINTEYTPWSSREKMDNSSSKRTRIRTETYTVVYSTTTTTNYSNTCSICGHSFPSSETSYGTATETDIQDHLETQYSVRGYVNVYIQDTKGNFHLDAGESESVAGSWSGWDYDINNCSVGFSWSRAITNTHYASNTHTGNANTDANISTTVTANNREWNRYIYRKQYYLRLHPNKQSDASTNIVNQSPSEYSIPSGQIYQQRKSYVGETYFVPKTYDTFQMIGYASYNTWYDQATGGTSIGENRNMCLIGSLSGYGDPNILFVKDLYARWYSEPGAIYLMPNSSSLGTDSCYGAYIDDGNEGSSEQEDTYLFNERPSDVGLNNTSRP